MVNIAPSVTGDQSCQQGLATEWNQATGVHAVTFEVNMTGMVSNVSCEPISYATV